MPAVSTTRSASKALSPTRSLFKTIVNVSVGPTKQLFLVHSELLCAASTFFAAALNPRHVFLESLSSTVHLPESRPDAFEYFLQWLYRRTLVHEALTGPHPAYYHLVRLYVLADVLGVEELRNDVVDFLAELADQTNSVPAPDDTRALWADVRDNAPLKALVLALFAWKKTENLIETHEDSWDERFLRELVVKLKKERNWQKGSAKAPWRKLHARCEKYHEHADKRSCYVDVEEEEVEVTVALRPKVKVKDNESGV